MLTFIILVIVQSLSCVRLYMTPWTVACQAPLSSIIFQSLLKFTSTELVMPSNHPILHCPFPLCLLSFPASGSFHEVEKLACLHQMAKSIGASASVNIQGWFPLGLAGLISLQFKGLSRIFSSTTIRKHKFFGLHPSLWSNFHIHMWLLEKPWLWLYGPLSAKWCLCFLINSLGLSQLEGMLWHF